MADQPILVLENVIKHREQGGVAFELQVPKLVLQRGSFVAFVGESGCGKSTLLDMLALVLHPTECGRFELYEGERVIDIKALWQQGDEAELARLRREMLGYVLQSGGLLPFLNVADNISLPQRLKSGHVQPEVINRMAERMGVLGLMKKKPQFLSGGQRQRVAILRAMAHDPLLILADEPTAAVDRKRAGAIADDFTTLAREHGSTIVMVTHDLKLVAPVADRVYGYEVNAVTERLTRAVCVAV